MKFKVLAGNHREGGRDGKTYHIGEVVETKHDLIKMFGKKKFERVGITIIDDSDETTAPAEIPAPPKEKPKAEEEEPDETEPEDEPEDDEDDSEAGIGEDVSKDFPDALDLDVAVFKLEDGTFNVVDIENHEQVQNKKPLLIEAEVTKFLDDIE